MQNFDVIVIGQGVMGLATSYALSKRQVSVLALEQNDLFHEKGSSHGESRAIRMAYFEHPSYIPLLQRAYQLWEEIQKLAAQEVFRKSGMAIYADPSTSVVHRGVCASAQQYKLPLKKLSPAAAQKAYPYFRAPATHECLFESNAGCLWVDPALHAMAQLAQAKLLLHSGETLLEWKQEKGHIAVQTNKAKYRCEKLIFSSGSWMKGLFPDLPLQLFRAMLFWFECKNPEARSYPAFAFDFGPEFYYGFPSYDGQSVKIASHTHLEPLRRPEDKEVLLPPSELLGDITRFVRDCLPQVSARLLKFSSCIYTMSPDENFILDQHPSSENVVVAAGFSGHGFKFAPVIGEILTELALERKTKLDIEFLRLRRLRSATEIKAK